MAELKQIFNKEYKALQLDGGGILGTMFLVFLSELEAKLGKQCHEVFDMIIGTSTGGIAGAMLAAGMPAKEILDLYLTQGRQIFKKRPLGFLNPWSWWSGQYDRKFIDGLCDKYMSMPMKDLKCDFIVTAVNMQDAKSTHFMKSYKDKYKDKITAEMVKRTYSAPTYFGYYIDDEGEWSDGGVGVQTCTLMEACVESKRQFHEQQNVWILSCGCGYTNVKRKNPGNFLGAQIADFIPIAREQSIWSQLRYAKELDYSFYRVDVEIDPKKNQMDMVKYLPYYKSCGEEMVRLHMSNVVEG